MYGYNTFEIVLQLFKLRYMIIVLKSKLQTNKCSVNCTQTRTNKPDCGLPCLFKRQHPRKLTTPFTFRAYNYAQVPNKDWKTETGVR